MAKTILTENQIELIVLAGEKEWHQIKDELPDKYPKSSAQLIRKNRGIPPFCAGQFWKDEEYFSTGSLESCYWAGFIAGDGCVQKDKRNPVVQVSIQLTGSDGSHLDRLHSVVGGTRKEYTRWDGRYKVERAVASWRVCSNKIADDLELKFNITEKKSLVAQPPVGLSEEQNLSFAAGLIDADGSYYVNNGGRPVFSFIGSYDVTCWINELLFDNFATVHSSGKVFTLAVSGDRAIIARDKLHALPGVPLMQRKLNAWEKGGATLHLSKRKDNKIGS